MNTIAIFDIGKTNKKLFLFNEQYKIVWERSVQFEEIKDEDGFPCENIRHLSEWIRQMSQEIVALKDFTVKAINFSAYGASLAYINAKAELVAPLYNYLKPYPAELKEKFYSQYGGESAVSVATASPVLGSLNSGMQLYRLKYEQPAVFDQITHALHFPQYISWLFTGKTYAEITSIGCHTALWDFTSKDYHQWVRAENISEKFPAILPSDKTITVNIQNRTVKAGIGLHDSSAALVPYLACFSEPFILLSTGTWCISFNPFNDEPLTAGELGQDCLCYIEYQGRPVKASRLFAGNEHEQQVKRLSAHFKVPPDYYKNLLYQASFLDKAKEAKDPDTVQTGIHVSAFGKRNLSDFESYEEAYHRLIHDIMQQQKKAILLVLSAAKLSRIFVDGGFAKNPVYMNMLAAAFPGMEVFAASVSQATALGAALAIHKEWNGQPVPGDMVELKYYMVTK
ncbi:MAG: hypothetical protein RLZZ28_1215 [Bacteroidota bacterium]